MLRERIKQSRTYKTVRTFYNRYERFLVPGFLLVGFVGDFITFRAINLSTAFVLLSVHLFLAASAILYMAAYDSDQYGRGFTLRYVRLAAPLVLQFSFGALLGATFVFYWFSGAFIVTWPVMLLIVALMISNETLREYVQRPSVQIALYSFLFLSAMSLMLPYAFNTVSAMAFLFGVAITVAVSFFMIDLVARVDERVRMHRQPIAFSVLIILAFVSALYFANIIPPIPLTIRDAGIYHYVSRTGSEYRLLSQERGVFDRLLPGTTIQVTENDPVYVFVAVHAPADLSTDIYHSWQYYDLDQKRWVNWSRPSYSISGGREDGYRGYSLISRAREGKWRVDIETRRGQVIGRLRFRVDVVDVLPELVEEVR